MRKSKNKAPERAKHNPALTAQLEKMLSTDFTTRGKLSIDLNARDIDVRNSKKFISYSKPIIADKNGSGYRYAKDFSKITLEERVIEWKEINSQIRYLSNYIESLNMTLMPLIAYKKAIEKKIPNKYLKEQ